MERVVVLGRGGAGKSTAARRLGHLVGLPVIELDQHFWRPGLVATPRAEWIELQQALATAPRWVMDWIPYRRQRQPATPAFTPAEIFSLGRGSCH